MTSTSLDPAASMPLPEMPASGQRARIGFGGDLVGAAALLSVAYVVSLWLSNGGLQDLARGAGTGLTSVGRVLGLVAADLLLLQCLLMARIPWAERTWGQDRLARWHRVLGFTSFHTMLAHAVVITVGYAAGDPRGVLGELWHLVWTYPGLLLATAGASLLTLVTVTSIRMARRRLRYESWHLLHLYAYLGVGLALPHQIWTGTDFVSSPWARAYWWSLWIGAAAAVLVYRVGVPAWRSWRHALRVTRVVPEAPGVVSVHLTGRRLEQLAARAGQFLVLRFLDGPGWSRGNPYSLSAAPHPAASHPAASHPAASHPAVPHPAVLRVTVAAAGDGSARVARLRPGTRVLLEGPYGRLTADARTDPDRPVVLLGAGVGVTPLRALLEEIDAPGRTTLVVRARTMGDVLFGPELDALARDRQIRIVTLPGPRARPGSWLPRQYAGLDDATALRRLVPDIAAAEVYVCGPVAWAESVTAAARTAGVPARRIHQERFSW